MAAGGRTSPASGRSSSPMSAGGRTSPSPGRSSPIVGPGRIRAPSPARTPTPRVATPTSGEQGEPVLVGEEMDNFWGSVPVQRSEPVRGPETYTLFRPDEIFCGPRSAQIRRLEEDVVDLRLDDIYSALVLPWQVDRKDVNCPHGTQWDSKLTPDYWVSSDSGRLCFAPAPVGEALSGAGQYHKAVGEEWSCYSGASDAPGNDGGFHCCTIDAGAPGDEWTLVAKLADFGVVLGRESGLRVEFSALVRSDSEALIASLGSHDECRSLFLVEQLRLPAGMLLVADPAELAESTVDGPAVPSGLGAGCYPVFVSRDEEGAICRITCACHDSRALKISRHFPPILSAGDSRPASSLVGSASVGQAEDSDDSRSLSSGPELE